MTDVLARDRRLLFMFFSLVCLTSRALAQLGAQRPLTHMDIERFADSAFATYVRESAAPSLAVVVVRGDSVLFAKGYGYARESIPVSVDSTVYHIASLSKLFVVTAVMQQVERGRLALDTPLTAVLPEFVIPRETRVRHLLTHTSGIDSPFLSDVVDEVSDLTPLSEYFAAHPPRFGRPPGQEIRYSNYGMALAALIVERASGEAFDAYVERHIFAPLQMRSSAIRQPPPPAVENRVATAGSRRTPDYLLIYPAGAIVSTPADIARFMRALLAATSNDSAVLSAQSRSEIKRRQWAAHRAIPGVALGFFESDMGGVRALFHTGARTHFSLIYLLPEDRVGVFVVHSMRQGGPFQSLRTDFARAFVERYFAREAPRVEQPDLPPASSIAGTYRPTLFSTSTIEKVAWLFADTRVVPNADGSLVLQLPASPALRLMPREGAFRVVDGSQEGLAVAFRGDANSGRQMFLSGATQDPISFEQLEWYEQGSLHLVLLSIAYAAIVSYSIAMLLTAAWRVITNRRRRVVSAQVRLMRLMPVPSALLSAAPLIALATLFLSSDAGGPRRTIAIGTTLVLGGAMLALASVPVAIIAWSNSYWGTARRVYITVYAVCSIVLGALVMYYHVGPVWM